MRWMVGGMVVVCLATAAPAEVLCVRVKKDGILSGAIKVRTECKRREVQVDGPMLGLCCDPFTTTTTSTTTTTGPSFTTLTTTAPTVTTTSTAPTGTTVTTTSTMPGASTTTSMPATTTITIVLTTTSTSTVTTTSLMCPMITTTTLQVNGCGGSAFACNGFCPNLRRCVSPDGISCQCVGALLPCGGLPDGTCGGTCGAGEVCAQVVNVGGDGCPSSYGCACIPG